MVEGRALKRHHRGHSGRKTRGTVVFLRHLMMLALCDVSPWSVSVDDHMGRRAARCAWKNHP